MSSEKKLKFTAINFHTMAAVLQSVGCLGIDQQCTTAAQIILCSMECKLNRVPVVPTTTLTFSVIVNLRLYISKLLNMMYDGCLYCVLAQG